MSGAKGDPNQGWKPKANPWIIACVVTLGASDLVVHCDGKTVKDLSIDNAYDLDLATQTLDGLLKQGYSIVGTATTAYLYQWTLQK